MSSSSPAPGSESPVSLPPTPRAESLDALRGLAILLMCLSGILPGALPNWMYHGYYPTHLPSTLLTTGGAANEIDAGPGNHLGEWEPVPIKKFRADWPSFTWVDAVFPMFLFAMGAAIPLSIHARRKRGATFGQLLLSSLARFGLLVGFAVYCQQVTPYFMENPPSAATWGLALLAMVPAGLVLTRLPGGWSKRSVLVLRSVGWASAIGVVAFAQSRSERAFSWDDKDIIILLLAWSSVLVSVATLIAGRWVWLRLLIVLPIAGLAHHQAMRPGWRVFGDSFDPWMEWLQSPKRWLDRSAWSGPLPDGLLDFSGLYDFTWFKFAGIVVLGTVIGDVLVKWQNKSSAANEAKRGFGRDMLLTVLLLTAVVGSFVGLKDYATTFAEVGGWRLASPYAALLLGGLPAVLAVLASGLGTKRDDDADGRYVRTLTAWGSGFLIIGMILAVLPGPTLDTAFGYFEGGIKKGPPATLSWYLVSLGVSVLLLAAGAVWIDVRRVRWPWAWVIANGQNPMLAYLGIRNLLAPLMALPVLWWVGESGSGGASVNAWMLSNVFDGGPWSAAVWAGVQTLGLAWVVWALTWRRVIWRV
ncbi:MAG: DUF5009 domain-containing protein [Planctomycetota bacterium]